MEIRLHLQSMVPVWFAIEKTKHGSVQTVVVSPWAPGEMKAMETVPMPAFKWLGENESCASLFTFISLFLTWCLYLEWKRNRSLSACLAHGSQTKCFVHIMIVSNRAQRWDFGVEESCFKALSASLLLFCRHDLCGQDEGRSLTPGRATFREEMLWFVFHIHLACTKRLHKSRICTK